MINVLYHSTVQVDTRPTFSPFNQQLKIKYLLEMTKKIKLTLHKVNLKL